MLLLLTSPGPVLGCGDKVKSNAVPALKKLRVKLWGQPGAVPTRGFLKTTIGPLSIRRPEKHIGREQLATRTVAVFLCSGILASVNAIVFIAVQEPFSVTLQRTDQVTETHSRQV